MGKCILLFPYMIVYLSSNLGSPSGRAATAPAVTERVLFVAKALSVSPSGCHLSLWERVGWCAQRSFTEPLLRDLQKNPGKIPRKIKKRIDKVNAMV